MFSTLKALHHLRLCIATTHSELFSFCPFTQRSPTASVNAGLKAATALRLERGCVPQSGISRSKSKLTAR
jgi:hypothetical protein